MNSDSHGAGPRLELAASLQPALAAYVRAQRWFGGKGRAMSKASITDYAWLGGDDTPDWLATIVVEYTDGAPEHYALWLGTRPSPSDLPLIASSPDGSAIVDVSGDHTSVQRLLRRVAEGADLPTEHGGRLRFTDVSDEVSAVTTRELSTRTLGADQSNTSVQAGPFVFKLFRRLQEGESPELEFGRFLTGRTAFRDFPALRGAVSYATPGRADTPLGVLQTWIDNVGDGWRYVQQQIARAIERDGGWDTMHADLFTLGARTGAFHAASASDASVPAFAPAPVTEDDVRRWTSGVAESARRAALHLPRASFNDAEQARLSEALASVARWDRALAPEISAAGGGFARIRIHGDYHLGQTLKTADGFVLIDFEGEPARSLEERRQKHSALKDVAGMLRSFDYALAVATGGSRERAAQLRTTLPMADAFLDGYFSTTVSAPFLPETRDTRTSWIRFFEVEKALYELEYEVNNRPDWAHIPALGLLRLLDD